MVDGCRMYEERFPEVDDVVMVQVKSIAEMGAYVTLLEYNNIEGSSKKKKTTTRSLGRTLCAIVNYFAAVSDFPPRSPTSRVTQA